MLDIPAVAWLSSYLNAWPNTLLVVSHDREFLDEICTDVLHLHHETLDAYKGNYTQFLTTREERRKHYEKEYETNLTYRRHLQDFVDKWRYNAARAALAQSKLKILEKLPVLKPWPTDPPVILKFPDVEKISPPLLQLDDVLFSYNMERDPLLKNINFSMQLDARVAIVGPNGAGKTTFLKLMTGALQPVRGKVFIHGRLRFAFFSQHHVDQLDLSMNPLQFLGSKFPGLQEEEYRRHLGAFGLSGPLALQPIFTLSGGQKSRLVFATLSLSYPHVLILDEPTNHLDVDSIDALIESLKVFQGGVVVVSHDTRFIEQTCFEILVCNDGTLKRYDGTIRQYVKSLPLDLPTL
jgi:ATP-binding cassette, subfamily F, member 3